MSSDIKDIWRGYWPVTKSGTPVITQSMVNTFLTCPREIYYGTVLGLRHKREAIALKRGTWLHALLEERANGGDWQAKHKELYEEQALTQFSEEVEELSAECYDIMQTYEWVYSNDDLTPIAAELPVSRPIFNGQAVYKGKIDLIVKDRNGDIWLVDHKTHRTLPDWVHRELAFQHYSYLWACRKSEDYLRLGIPQPRGFIYDYCKTQTIKHPSLTKLGKLSRQLKPEQTSYPVFVSWLRDNTLLTTVAGKDMLVIEDDEERVYVEEFLEILKTQDYTHMFRRDKLVFDLPQQVRQIKAFLATAKRMLQYRWDDPDTVERGSHVMFPCKFQDLSLADLIHGDSRIERKTAYYTNEDPLDYYNEKKDKK